LERWLAERSPAGTTTGDRSDGPILRPSLHEGPSSVAVRKSLNYNTGHKSKLDNQHYSLVVAFQALFCTGMLKQTDWIRVNIC